MKKIRYRVIVLKAWTIGLLYFFGLWSQTSAASGVLGGFLDGQRDPHHFSVLLEAATSRWAVGRRTEQQIHQCREFAPALRLDYTFDIALHPFFGLGLGSSLGTFFGSSSCIDRSFGLHLPGLHTLLVVQALPQHRWAFGLGSSLLRYKSLRWQEASETYEIRATLLALPEFLFSWDYRLWKEAGLQGQVRWMRAFFERPRQARNRPEDIYVEQSTLSLGVGIVYSF